MLIASKLQQVDMFAFMTTPSAVQSAFAPTTNHIELSILKTKVIEEHKNARQRRWHPRRRRWAAVANKQPDRFPGTLSGSIATQIFFSPHPDDIAYSCFGSVEQGRGATRSGSRNKRKEDSRGGIHPWSREEQVIVTVFNKSRCANGEVGYRLGQDVETVTPARQAEDEAFAASMGCRLISLGFGDSSARDEPSRRPCLAAADEKEMLEMTKANAAYRHVEEHLEAIVRWAVECEAEIYLPLGVGCHIDHWMTRVAVTSLLDRIRQERHDGCTLTPSSQIITSSPPLASPSSSPSQKTVNLCFYEDMPYAFYASAEHINGLIRAVVSPLSREEGIQEGSLVCLDEKSWIRKREAILSYETQMKPTILGCMEKRASALARSSSLTTTKGHDWAERIWKLEYDV